MLLIEAQGVSGFGHLQTDEGTDRGEGARENASNRSLTRGSRDQRRHSHIRRGVPLAERAPRGAPSFADSGMHPLAGTRAHGSGGELRGRGGRDAVVAWACQ